LIPIDARPTYGVTPAAAFALVRAVPPAPPCCFFQASKSERRSSAVRAGENAGRPGLPLPFGPPAALASDAENERVRRVRKASRTPRAIPFGKSISTS